MAIRKLRIDGDPILRKQSKTVKEINENIITLIEDMRETLDESNGVGLAAVQVGSLRRIILVKPEEDEKAMVLINPEIVECDGAEVGLEGCLSVPGKHGKVERPQKIQVKAMDADGKNLEFEAEDFVARIICHEVDHTNGILYTDKIYENQLFDDEDLVESDL